MEDAGPAAGCWQSPVSCSGHQGSDTGETVSVTRISFIPEGDQHRRGQRHDRGDCRERSGGPVGGAGIHPGRDDEPPGRRTEERCSRIPEGGGAEARRGREAQQTFYRMTLAPAAMLNEQYGGDPRLSAFELVDMALNGYLWIWDEPGDYRVLVECVELKAGDVEPEWGWVDLGELRAVMEGEHLDTLKWELIERSTGQMDNEEGRGTTPAGTEPAEPENRHTVPKYAETVGITLASLRKRGRVASNREIEDGIVAEMNLSEEAAARPHGDGPRTRVGYNAAWTHTWLRKIGAIEPAAGSNAPESVFDRRLRRRRVRGVRRPPSQMGERGGAPSRGACHAVRPLRTIGARAGWR